MKNILVPTDLSVQSLNIVHEIVSLHEKVNIYFVHMVEISDDIHDLLFMRKSHLMAQVPEKFFEAIELLKNKYQSQVMHIGLEFFYGSRVTILNSILESCNISEICVLNNYKYTKPLKQSVDMLPLINRCKVAMRKLPVKGRVMMHGDANRLSSLITEDVM